MENKLIEQCLVLLSIIKKPILIVRFPTEQLKAFVFENFHHKIRDVFQNEVEGAQDITILVANLPINVGTTDNMRTNLQSIDLQIQNLPKIDFAFGGDDFVMLKNIRKNIY